MAEASAPEIGKKPSPADILRGAGRGAADLSGLGRFLTDPLFREEVYHDLAGTRPAYEEARRRSRGLSETSLEETPDPGLLGPPGKAIQRSSVAPVLTGLENLSSVGFAQRQQAGLEDKTIPAIVPAAGFAAGVVRKGASKVDDVARQGAKVAEVTADQAARIRAAIFEAKSADLRLSHQATAGGDQNRWSAMIREGYDRAAREVAELTGLSVKDADAFVRRTYPSDSAEKIAAALAGRAASPKVAEVPGFAKTAEQRIATGRAPIRATVDEVLGDAVSKPRAAPRTPLGTKQTAAGFRDMEETLRFGEATEVVPGQPTQGFQTAKFDQPIQPVIETVKDFQAAKVEPRVAPFSWSDQALAGVELGAKAARDLPRRGELSAKVARLRMDMVAPAETVLAVAGKPAAQRTTQETLDGLMAFRELAGQQATLSEGASEVARTLNQLRAEVNVLSRLGGDENLAKAVRIAAGDQKNADKIFDAFMKFRNDPPKLHRLLKDSRKPNFLNAVDEYVRANALWGPSTHILNVTSGYVQQALLVGGEAIADPKHAIPMLQSWIVGHRQAFGMLPKALSEGGDLSKYGVYSRPGGEIPGRLGDAIRTSYKALAIEDLFQRVPAFNAKLNQLGHKAADAKGLGLRSKERGALIADFVSDPPDEAWRAALKFADEATLRADGKFVEFAQKARRDLPWIRPFMLFVTAPINAAKLGVRYSPVGAVRPVTDRLMGYAEPTTVGRAFRESVVMGGAVTAGFIAMLGEDNMTGLVPKSKAELEAWRAQGRGPMQIRASEYPLLGPIFRAWFDAQGEDASERWVSAYLLGPLIWPAMMAAAFYEVENERQDIDMEERAIYAAQAVGHTVLQQIPTFQGFQGLQRALEDPLGNGIDFIANYSRLAVPFSTALATTAKWADDIRRDPEGIVETIITQLPPTPFNTPSTMSIRPLIDVLGRDVPNDSHGANVLVPRATTEQPHPVLQEEERLLRTVPKFAGFVHPGNRFDFGQEKIELDADKHNDLKRAVGTARAEALLNLLASGEYQSAPDVEKARLYEQTAARAAESGRRAFGLQWAAIADNPDDIARATWLSMIGSNFAKAEALNTVRQAGKLSEGVAYELNSIKGADDPTVGEYLHGYDLVDTWRKTPAHTIGTPEVWTVAKRAREQYMALIKDMTAAERNKNAAVQDFYKTAASGWFRVLYEKDGDRNEKYIHETRKMIAKDKNWDRFSAAVRDLP